MSHELCSKALALCLEMYKSMVHGALRYPHFKFDILLTLRYTTLVKLCNQDAACAQNLSPPILHRLLLRNAVSFDSQSQTSFFQNLRIPEGHVMCHTCCSSLMISLQPCPFQCAESIPLRYRNCYDIVVSLTGEDITTQQTKKMAFIQYERFTISSALDRLIYGRTVG